MEKYTWKRINYKLMSGKWKIGIILEAGYKAVNQLKNMDNYIKITPQIYFKNLLLPYPYSQSMKQKEIDAFCKGLLLSSKYINQLFFSNLIIIIVLNNIQFSDCDIQDEAVTAAAIQWASEIFCFAMPYIGTCFD